MDIVAQSNALLNDITSRAEEVKADAKAGDANAQHIVAFGRRLYNKKASLGTYTLLKDRYDAWVRSKG